MGVSKSFGTKQTENHLDNSSALFFGQALDQMGQKCQYLAQNASFGPNLAVFGEKSKYLREKAPCLHCYMVGHETTWAKNANIWPKK